VPERVGLAVVRKQGVSGGLARDNKLVSAGSGNAAACFVIAARMLPSLDDPCFFLPAPGAAEFPLLTRGFHWVQEDRSIVDLRDLEVDCRTCVNRCG